MKTLHLSIMIIVSVLVIVASSDWAHAQLPSGNLALRLISISKSNFADGEIIPIRGHTLPNSTVNISLSDNLGNLENSTQVSSDNTGYFYTNLGIPSHVIGGGSWHIFAKSHNDYNSIQIQVNTHGVVTMPDNFPSGLSPLKQFRLGIPTDAIQCHTSFQLVLNAEDGHPACVKPDTAKILYKRGWGLLENKLGTDTSLNQNMFSSTNCTGTEISKNQNGSLVVLLMKPNSTATVCTTYQFDSSWESYPNKSIYEGGMAHFGFSLGPKFNVTATPSLLNITNASNGDAFSIIYKISLTSDSKGIYDYSIPWDTCEQYPLAVGYDSSELKKSDFPLEVLLMRPCFNVIFHVTSNTIISGMNYTEVIVKGQ